MCGTGSKNGREWFVSFTVVPSAARVLYTPWAKEEFWLLKYFSSLFWWCPQLWIHLFFLNTSVLCLVLRTAAV